MRTTDRKISQLLVEEVSIAFNFNRLQAVLCMMASAAVTSGLLYTGVRHLLG
jgi:hypothetical protein